MVLPQQAAIVEIAVSLEKRTAGVIRRIGACSPTRAVRAPSLSASAATVGDGGSGTAGRDTMGAGRAGGGHDNTVGWKLSKLQLPDSRLRRHWVRARVRVHEYPDGALSVPPGPRCIARYNAQGMLTGRVPTGRGVMP